MELFIIQCTTCRARLKVNDESVIGDILGCPKCGSMVQVVPPVGWKRGDSCVSPAASVAVSSEGPSRTPAEVAPKAAAVVPPVLPARAVTSAVSEANAVSVAPNVVATASLISPLLARIKQDWVLLGCGLASGILLGAAAWVTVYFTGPDQPTVVAQANDPKSPSPSDDEPAPKAATQAQVEEPLAAQANVPGERAEAGAAAPIKQPASEARELDPGKQQAPQRAVDVPDKAAAATPAAALQERAPGIKLQPVEKRPIPAGTEDNTAASVTDERPAADESQEGPPAAAKPPAAPATSTADAGPPKLTSEEIDERMSGNLPAVKMVNVPLAQFVDFISNYAGLPIAIDDAALAKAGKKRQTPVNVRLKDTTARDALTTVVKSIGLTCIVRDGRLVVTADR